MEITFSVTVYPIDGQAAAGELRERLQDLILAEIEARGLYMGPLVAIEEAADGEEA